MIVNAATLAKLRQRNRINSLPETLCFDKQIAFIRDPAKKKACLTPRRSGKTTGLGVELAQDALRFPGRKQLYLGKTRDTAENAIWKHVLEQMLIHLGIRHKYGSVEKKVTFENGSTIKFAGIDNSPQDMRKLLGGKYHRVIIDECQDQTQDLRTIVEEMIEPAVSDYYFDGGGFIELAGTPGTRMGENLWWLVTRHDRAGNPDPLRIKGWSVHEWAVADNPHMAREYEMLCKSREAERGPTYRLDPGFRRQWLGKWVHDCDELVYKFSLERNVLADPRIEASLLRTGNMDWNYLVGIDLGWDDATAFAVCAYSDDEPTLYVVESVQYKHTVLSSIGLILKAYMEKYQPDRMVVDAGSGTGKLAAESLKNEFGLPIVPAQKTEKETAIARMNSDFLGARIKVIESTNRELMEEWSKLIIDKKSFARGVFKEAAPYANHLADAALYAHRDSLHPYAEEAKPKPQEDVAERILERQRRMQLPRHARDFFGRIDDARAAKAIVERFR